MKKYFLFSLIVAVMPCLCFGASSRYTQLVREKQRKMEQLEKCMGTSKGLQIAGVSTLGLTAVGVAGNIYEAQEIKKNAATIESNTSTITKRETENKKLAEKKAEKEAQAEPIKEEGIEVTYVSAANQLVQKPVIEEREIKIPDGAEFILEQQNQVVPDSLPQRDMVFTVPYDDNNKMERHLTKPEFIQID